VVAARFHAALEIGQVGAGQVSATAKELREQRRQQVQRVLAGLAGGHRVRFRRKRRQCGVQSAGITLTQIAHHAALKLGRLQRKARAIGLELLAPGPFGRDAARHGIPGRRDILRNLERRRRPAQRLARGGHFRSPQRSPMHIVRAGLVG
jgi:hypothetical protein